MEASTPEGNVGQILHTMSWPLVVAFQSVIIHTMKMILRIHRQCYDWSRRDSVWG